MSSQVFAAQGRSRPRMMRALLSAGAVLIAAWVAALAFGALGGFDSLPRPNLFFEGGDGATEGGDGATEAKDSGPDQPVQATRSARRERRRAAVSSQVPTGGIPAPPKPRRVIESPATTGGIPAVDEGTGSPSDTPDSEAPGNDGQALRRLK
jgi:hypothetical protein